MSIGKKIDLFLELPSVPIFYDTNGKVINNLTAPYTIKSELKVKCEVVGGKLSSSIVKKFLYFLFVQYTNIPWWKPILLFFWTCMLLRVHTMYTPLLYFTTHINNEKLLHLCDIFSYVHSLRIVNQIIRWKNNIKEIF